MIRASDICKFLQERNIDFDYDGREDLVVERFSPLKDLKGSSITWVKNKDASLSLEKGKCKDLLVVAPRGFASGRGIASFIYCDSPKAVFFEILERFFANDTPARIDGTAIVKTDKIGEGVSIGCHCFIGEDVEIGDHVSIGNNVSIECPTRIGNDSIIHSGTVIGTDGFGYYEEGGITRKVPHFGGVVIGERVEVGANACIDRGTMEDTVIGDDTKIDNLCHIAHNVRINGGGIVIALSCLCGSSVLEEGAYVAPGATVMNQVRVGENSLVGLGAVVTKDVPDGKVVAGVPAREIRDREK